MKYSVSFLCGLMLTASALPGQSVGKGKNADEDWNRLVALTTPSTAPAGTKKTLPQIKEEKAQKIANARQAAAEARNFHLAYPEHPNAKVAKKMEALAGLQGVTDDNPQQEVAAQLVAKTYREDATQPRSDRFQVALLAERTQARGKFGGRVYVNDPAELELIAEKLRREFGDVAEVFNFYVSIARSADMTTAVAIATKMMQWPVTPEAKIEAQAILARQALLNQPLNVKLTTLEGEEIDLARQQGRVTLLYIWPASGPGMVRRLNEAKAALPADVQVVYFSPTATAEQIGAARGVTTVSGVFCKATPGVSRSVLEQLGVRRLPYVFALGRDGKLASFGPAEALASIVNTAAGR